MQRRAKPKGLTETTMISRTPVYTYMIVQISQLPPITNLMHLENIKESVSTAQLNCSTEFNYLSKKIKITF